MTLRIVYPNPRLQSKWIEAVKYLRSKDLWVLETQRKPTWRALPEEQTC